MWISRKTYETYGKQVSEITHERIAAQVRAATLVEQNKVLQTNLDWLRVRVNQLEHERAQLLWNYLGVKVQIPEIQRVSPTADTPPHPLSELPSFNDVGEAEAKRLGIEWDAEGRVVYTK